MGKRNGRKAKEKEKEGKDGRMSGVQGGSGVLEGRTYAGSPLMSQRHNSLCSNCSSLHQDSQTWG